MDLQIVIKLVNTLQSIRKIIFKDTMFCCFYNFKKPFWVLEVKHCRKLVVSYLQNNFFVPPDLKINITTYFEKEEYDPWYEEYLKHIGKNENIECYSIMEIDTWIINEMSKFFKYIACFVENEFKENVLEFSEKADSKFKAKKEREKNN